MLFQSAIEKLVEDVALEPLPAGELVVLPLIELTVVERLVPLAVSVAVLVTPVVVDPVKDVAVELLLPQVVVVLVSEAVVVRLTVTEVAVSELVVASATAKALS